MAAVREIGAFEAKSKFGTVLDWVEQGEEVLITRRGRAIALVIPSAARSQEQCRKAAQRIRERAAAGHQRFDWAEWKTYRDEGRR
ncbi:MAG: type II toxin-antitoxin system prevent-host-death family antitoxin [Burkholderiaceae bacterium]